MKLTIINSLSKAERSVKFECFHGGPRSPWAEVRFGVAGVYNFSLLSGWEQAKRSEAPVWHLDLASLEQLRAAHIEQGGKVKHAPLYASYYPPPSGRPKAPRSRKQVAPEAQLELVK